jgi:hypothetical protein
MWMDIHDGSDGPRRGDRLRSPKTLYWVLHSRKVKRRDPAACPRYQLFVVKADECDAVVKSRLLNSALRRGSSRLFEFQWYPRKKKRKTFEQYMQHKQQSLPRPTGVEGSPGRPLSARKDASENAAGAVNDALDQARNPQG